ncbi:MAG: gluconokinase [Marmoricola sp.]
MEQRAQGAPRIVVCGVSGSGKSTIGEQLAARLDVTFCDGDDLHPEENRRKMRAGTPLDDDDRRPWLLEVGRWLADQEGGGVVACSALKRTYRDLIRDTCPEAWFAQLVGDEDVIIERQRNRKQHFMPPSLMPSQFAAFEGLQDDEAGAAVDVGPAPERLVADIVKRLRR